jgi:AcrR family transcriptional regulator
LLDTAAALFWEKGFAATTTREIAAALQIQQASLYYHVQSKEDLLYQICTTSLQRFLKDIPAALSGVSSPLERVRALIRAHVTTLLRHQTRNVAMLTELRSLSRGHRTEVIELRERYTRLVRGVLEEAQSAKMVRDDIHATYLLLALLNMLNWSALWFRPDQPLSVEALAELFLKIYIEGVMPPSRRTLVDTRPPGETKRSPSRPRKAARAARGAEHSTMDRLLHAAVALFSRKGYAATSTREVAALLGLQKASLYYHIESKEDLLYFICQSSLQRIRSDVTAAISEVRDPLERIRALMRAHLESMLRDQDEHSTTLSEMHSLSPERFSRLLALRHGYEDLVRSVLADAQAAGAIRGDIDVKYLCLSLLGLLNRVLVWYRRRGVLSPAQLGNLLSAILLGGIAKSIPASAPRAQ